VSASPGRWVEQDAASFTIELLPVEAFEALVLVTGWYGEVLVDDPPYLLEVHLQDPSPCWCRFELMPEAGASMIGMTVVPEVILAGELGVCYASCVLISDAEIDVRHEDVVHAAPQRRADALAALPELVRAIGSGVELALPRRIWRPRFRRWWR